MSKYIKILIGVVVVIVIIFLIYKIGSSRSDTVSKEATTRVDYTTEVNTVNQGEAASLLRTLRNLQKVQLNGDIFADPAFRNLFDFSKVLTPIDKYRQNPFSPIGAQAVVSRQDNVTVPATTVVNTSGSAPATHVGTPPTTPHSTTSGTTHSSSQTSSQSQTGGTTQTTQTNHTSSQTSAPSASTDTQASTGASELDGLTPEELLQLSQ